MKPLAAVILAAGKGTRMRCKTPKVLQSVAGQPMIFYALELATALQASPLVVVVGREGEQIQKQLPASGWQAVKQIEPLGTGDALRQTAGFSALQGPGITVTLNDSPRRGSDFGDNAPDNDDLVVHQGDVQAVPFPIQV